MRWRALRESTPLPWRRPRREALVLVLVALAALTPLHQPNSQDTSRLCLSQSLARGSLHNDGCFGIDVARYKGHEFSDKAPGLSLVQFPLEEAARVPASPNRIRATWRLWLVRVLSVGVAFLALAFVLGRIGEGLAPGFGAVSLVAFALGTLVAAFAVAGFDQVPAAALGFGAFALAWRRRPGLAGLLGGAAILVEYQAAAIVAIVALYVVAVGPPRRVAALARYAAGVVPGVAILGLYDWLAFGAPWRLSYRYVANEFESAQAGGLFGIRLPRPFASYDVFAGPGGLLLVSPVLVAAVWGLVRLWRRQPLEVIVCGTVAVVFVFLNCGYFLPYGGSPGPRFLIPGLPFLAVGLGPAFAWRPRLTAALALLSILGTTALRLVWSDAVPLRAGVWGELVHVPSQLRSSRFVRLLEPSVFDWVAPGHAWGAGLVALLGIASFVVALSTVPREALRPHRERRGLQLAFVVVTVALLAAAAASSVVGYPYERYPSDLSTAIQGSSAAVARGQEVDYVVTAYDSSRYQGYSDAVLTIRLSPGMKLRGSPAYERGSGCNGAATITCRLGDLSPRMSTPVRLAVTMTAPGPQTLKAALSAAATPAGPAASFTVEAT
jgi:hypothetical protein